MRLLLVFLLIAMPVQAAEAIRTLDGHSLPVLASP
jgi:hypothetical protein